MRNWRINLVFILFFIFGAAVIGRLFYVQVLNHQKYRAWAQGQQKIFSPFKGERGEVFFQDGAPLAINRNSYFAYAAPNEIKEPVETARTLSPILALDENLILEKLKKESFYELLKKKLTEEEANQLKKINLPGIYLKEESLRYYPQGTLASQVIGFLDADGQGQYGVEGSYEDILQGKEGVIETEKGPAGFLANDKSGGMIEKGSDIFLTLDYNIQFKAEKLLKEAKENLRFEEGEIIVSEPKSGKILALANFPEFDPNKYSEVSDFAVFQNSSLQKIFEPGSVMKPITMASALEEEKITPQTAYVDEGFLKIGGYTIRNYDKRTWGRRTMTEVLEKSINTGAVFAERQIGDSVFEEYLGKFGIFEPTGIDLQGEVFSKNKELKKGYEINFATAAFGQGIEMTSMQLVRAFSVIANNGKLIKPYIVEKILEKDKIKETQPEIQNPSVISQKTATQLTAMLISVTENGFAKGAKVPGYYIAGKTGTAQIPWGALGVNRKGYSDKTIQSFIGFAPALDPQFLILVKLKDPQTASAISSVVAIFQKLAKYIIDSRKIPPDHE